MQTFTIDHHHLGDPNKLTENAIFSLMSQAHTDARDWMKVFGISSEGFPFDVNVTVTIGNVEVDFKQLLDLWYKTFDDTVIERAKEIIEAKFGRILNKLGDIESQISSELDLGR